MIIPMAVGSSRSPGQPACPLNGLGCCRSICFHTGFESGSPIYRADEEATVVYRLNSGAVKLTHMFPDGDGRIVHIAHAGDFIGLEALVHGRYRHQATGLSSGEVCRLPVRRLQRAILESPELNRLLLGHWQKDLDDAHTWLANFTTGTAMKRLARFLLHYARRAGCNPIQMPLTRRDLAAIVSLTTETVSRTMAKMRRRGLVRQIGRSGFRLDLNGLQALLEAHEEKSGDFNRPRFQADLTQLPGPVCRPGDNPPPRAADDLCGLRYELENLKAIHFREIELLEVRLRSLDLALNDPVAGLRS